MKEPVWEDIRTGNTPLRIASGKICEDPIPRNFHPAIPVASVVLKQTVLPLHFWTLSERLRLVNCFPGILLEFPLETATVTEAGSFR